MARPKKYHIILTEEERARLKKLAKSPESKKLIRKRINILLDLDESQDKCLTYASWAPSCLSITTCGSISSTLGKESAMTDNWNFLFNIF